MKTVGTPRLSLRPEIFGVVRFRTDCSHLAGRETLRGIKPDVGGLPFLPANLLGTATSYEALS